MRRNDRVIDAPEEHEILRSRHIKEHVRKTHKRKTFLVLWSCASGPHSTFIPNFKCSSHTQPQLIASSTCSTLSVCWQKHILLNKEQSKMYVREYETVDLTILNNAWSSVCMTGTSKCSNTSVHFWPRKINESKYKLNNNNNNKVFYFYFFHAN
jgi:hypothetical protein